MRISAPLRNKGELQGSKLPDGRTWCDEMQPYTTLLRRERFKKSLEFPQTESQTSRIFSLRSGDLKGSCHVVHLKTRRFETGGGHADVIKLAARLTC